MNPREFLEQEGFDLTSPHDELRGNFALSLGKRSAANLAAKEALVAGLCNATDLYRLPENLTQSSLLLSIDRNRYVRNLQFLKRTLVRLDPSSIVEFGSGDGLALHYARTLLPDCEVLGIEREANLAKIANAERGIETRIADYRAVANESGKVFELGLCNFGWENSDLTPSTRPHVIRRLGKHEICQACAEDMRDELIPIMQAWKTWLTEEATLIVAGRITSPTEGWAFASAAGQCGWNLSLKDSSILRVPSDQGLHEHFPHLVFKCESRSFDNPDKIDKLNWRAS